MFLTNVITSYFCNLLKIRKKPMIVAIGDVHGKFAQLTDKIELLKLEKNINFVQVGDFGLGFDSPLREIKKMKELDLLLQRMESKIWVIRGNHDNPILWHPDFRYNLDNIIFVQDNTFVDIEGKSCFFAGGAISIDRINRKKGATYWPQEPYRWNEPTDVPSRVDHVFTHDVYHYCSPFTIESAITNRWMSYDGLLRDDLINSQKEMKSMYEFIASINDDFSWHHGHYHESHFTSIGRQKTYCLSELEFKEVI